MTLKDAYGLDADEAPTAVVKTQLPSGLDHLQGKAGGKAGAAQAPSSVLHVAADKQLGAQRYAVERELGRGGMGQVMKVFDRDLNRPVAMKVLNPELRKLADVEKFLAEAQINSQLEHPNMVPVHDLGLNSDGGLYFTMRVVRGHRTLRDIVWQLRQGDVRTHAAYTLERRVQLVQQLCHAFQYAHQRGVIHCDIKPSNIVVGDCGEMFIVDWGIAMLSDEEGVLHPHGKVATSTCDDDETGQFSGTLKYMAPERLRHDGMVTARTDIFSLCAVLYELLSLHHYLGERENAPAIELLAHVKDGVRVPAEHYLDPHNGRVPRSLSRICAWGLRTDPALRFETMASLNQALQDWVEGKAPMVCPGTTIQRGFAAAVRMIDRRPVLMPTIMITTFVALLALLIAGTLALVG